MRNTGDIHSASRDARYSLTVTTCTPSPLRALRYAGSVATRVLPSPVRISEMRPWCRVMPPTSCTSKWRIFSVRTRRLANDGESLGKQLVQRGPTLQAFAELCRLCAQLLVRKPLHGRLEARWPARPACCSCARCARCGCQKLASITEARRRDLGIAESVQMKARPGFSSRPTVNWPFYDIWTRHDRRKRQGNGPNGPFW